MTEIFQNTQRSIYLAARVANEGLDGWLRNVAVMTENTRIKAVLPVSSLPSDFKDTHYVYNLGDVSLLPGLVDAHSHMHCSATYDAYRLVTQESPQRLTARAVDNMRRCLLSGTTTVRDLGGRNDVTFAVRDAIKDKVVPGPRLIVSGTPITITAGHCWFFGTEADTQDEVVAAVRRQVRMGAQVVKIMATGGYFTPTSNPRSPQYDASTLRAAVVEAERMGVQVAAHVLSAEGIRNCLKAGVHYIIHARWFAADLSRGLEFDEEAAREIADKNIWVDPTLGHMMIAEELVREGKSPPRPNHWALSANEPSLDENAVLFRRMDELGVRFTAGLDMGMFGARHDNSAVNAWAACEKLGWDNWRAIRMCTTDTAEALGLSREVGRLKPNMLADMAAFEGDPAENIRDMYCAKSVIQEGIPVKIDHKVTV